MERVSMQHGGQDRPFHLHVPAGIGERAALVVGLHGRGTDPLRFDGVTGLRAFADEAGFVAALPAAVGGVWNDGRDALRSAGPDDVSYLDAVIEHVGARHAIDPARVYLVGMSNGAAMAGRFALERAERIAGIGQVAGTAAEAIATRTRPGRAIAVMQIHGSDDEIAPYAGGSRSALRARLLVRRSFGASIGVDDWAQLWVDALGTTGAPETEVLPELTIRTWRDAAGTPAVSFYRVEGGGHTWPGSRIRLPRLFLGRTTFAFEATRALWAFLDTNRARST